MTTVTNIARDAATFIGGCVAAGAVAGAAGAVIPWGTISHRAACIGRGTIGRVAGAVPRRTHATTCTCKQRPA